MPLKQTEIFVRDCLQRHFQMSSGDIWEGEDPPDIYLRFNGNTIAVEISTLSFVSYDKNENLQNRNTQDSFGIKICEEINNEIKNEISEEIDVLLTLYVPVDKPKKYKEILVKELRNYLSSNPKYDESQIIEMNGAKADVKIIKNRHYTDKKVDCFIVNQNSTANIFENAKATLNERIMDKNFKCGRLNKEIFWLAMLNDYWLASYKTYERALEQLKISHIFKKILIINHDQSVHNIIKT